MIADVYRQAEGVLVWLGEARPTDCLASRTLHSLADFARQRMKLDEGNDILWLDLFRANELGDTFETTKNGLGGEISCQCHQSAAMSTALSLHEAVNAITTSIWTRPRFERLWVLQEIAPGKIVIFHYGKHSKSIEQLGFAAEVIHASYSHGLGLKWALYEAKHLLKASALLEMVKSLEASHSNSVVLLIRLLGSTSDSLVSVAHDRLFVVRAKANFERVENLEPDDNLQLPELWLRLGVCIFEELSVDIDFLWEKSMVLGVAGTKEKFNYSSLPSWVPDWDH